MKPWKQIHHDILGFFLRTNNNEQFFYKLKFTIMKKVLTLVSALSMVAGSAVAHDYSWSVGKTPTTDKNHEVAGCVGLTYNNNVYSFKAEVNDEVHVSVINDDNTDIDVIIGNTSYKVTKGKKVELTHRQVLNRSAKI